LSTELLLEFREKTLKSATLMFFLSGKGMLLPQHGDIVEPFMEISKKSLT
jgi:hypothetical protein